MSYSTARKTADVSGSGAGACVADEYPQLQEHFTKNDVRLSKAPKPIAEAFLADFPNGEFYSMETSQENDWCGLHAIRNSMLAYARQNPLVHVKAPTIPDLLEALNDHATKVFEEWCQLDWDYKVPQNFFSGDELRIIFKAWAFELGGLDKNRWGGVQLGFIAANAGEERQQPRLTLQQEIPESTKSKLPSFRIWIFHNGHGHWEGIHQGPREEANQLLPQLGHHQPEMRPSIPHILPGGQPALPTWSFQPKQLAEQLPTATPNPDWNPPQPRIEDAPVPALSIGEFQSQPQLEYDFSDLGHLDELHLPSEKPYQSLRPSVPQVPYRPYQPSLSLTNPPGLQVESLRGGCQLLYIQHGMHATSQPPPAPTHLFTSLVPGVGQDFSPSWFAPLQPVSYPFLPGYNSPGPPNFSSFPSQVPPPLEEPEWTFSPSPSPLIPYTQPFSPQWIMAGFQGQGLQVQAGSQQASSPLVQPSVRPAATQKRRMLTEVEVNKGQEEERPAKKRRGKWKCVTRSLEVHVPGSPSLGASSNIGTPFRGI